MLEEAALTFRPLTGEDLPFLHDSWGSSYFRGSAAFKYLTPDEFHAFHRPIRERFFAKPTATCIVCSPAEDPWHIIGWIAVEAIPSGLILQYLYVKSAFKGQGVARELVKRAIPRGQVFFTHLTDRAARIMAKKQAEIPGFKFIPHLV